MDLNLSNSEILKTFNEKRNEFVPYGLTCEIWTPCLMRKPDRHNEIEINYSPESTVTYLFQDKKITIPAKKLAIFWGLVPHQIINFEGTKPYFVCTIPFSQFLEWKLPDSFVDRVLKGEVLFETSENSSSFDEFLLNNWFDDLNDVISGRKSALLHFNCLLLIRFSFNCLKQKKAASRYRQPINLNIRN